MSDGGAVGLERVGAVRAATLLMAIIAVVVGSPVARAADDPDDGLSSGWSDRLSDNFKSGITKATRAMGLNKPPGPAPKEAPSGCPSIAVLDGTQVSRVMAPGVTGNGGLRYQYSLYDVGRECTLVGGQVNVKVGAGGRVLLGPAGSAGRFDVPIRVVVFSEVEQKPIQSKLFKVPATIAAGQASVPFQLISDAMAVSIPAGRSAADYSIKIGIDAGKGEGGDPTTAAKPRHRVKKEAAANAAE